MNILFFLTPKKDVAFLYEDETLLKAMEKMEANKYSCIPILTTDGFYAGTISEGDLLWTLQHTTLMNLEETGGIPIASIARRADYKPVHVDSDMEDLLDKAINQNFVPVLDDADGFIGIITRKEIIKYCRGELKRLKSLDSDGGLASKSDSIQ